MLKSVTSIAAMLTALSMFTGCSSQEVAPAHKGRMFEKTGVLALYSGGKGFDGPVLNPGTYFTGIYPEIRTLDCSTRTFKEPMNSMTKDTVQFALDVYVTVSANCDVEPAVVALLNRLAPVGKLEGAAAGPGAGNATPDEKDPVETDADRAITSRQVYNTFVRPALGEAVRQAISSYDANDINSHREELFVKIKTKLDSDLKGDPQLVTVTNFNLSNFKLPDEMANAAADRATQQVLRDKSVAEQGRIRVETDTAKLQIAKAQAEAEQDVARIDAIGAAYHRNPEYVTIEALHYAGDRGNMIMMPTNGLNTIVQLPARK